MSDAIYQTARNSIYEWVVVAKGQETWTNADGETCGEDFYRQDLKPFVIGDRACVIGTDEDGIEQTESEQQVLDRLVGTAIEQANIMWGKYNWSQLEFLEKVWHKQQYNKNLRDQEWPVEISDYTVIEHRSGRDWYAEQQAETARQLDAWFVA
jgi:hypothetical protein